MVIPALKFHPFAFRFKALEMTAIFDKWPPFVSPIRGTWGLLLFIEV
jgi:hypothetical protein